MRWASNIVWLWFANQIENFLCNVIGCKAYDCIPQVILVAATVSNEQTKNSIFRMPKSKLNGQSDMNGSIHVVSVTRERERECDKRTKRNMYGIAWQILCGLCACGWRWRDMFVYDISLDYPFVFQTNREIDASQAESPIFHYTLYSDMIMDIKNHFFACEFLEVFLLKCNFHRVFTLPQNINTNV